MKARESSAGTTRSDIATDRLGWWLVEEPEDLGCEQCFEQLAALVEDGGRAPAAIAAAAHVRVCPACREDAMGLLALGQRD
jgi:hypothetical protein